MALQGVEVVSAEALPDRTAEDAISAFANDFLHAWHRDETGDFSHIGNLSLGRLVAYFLLARVQPAVLVRSGEVFRLLFERFPGAREIVTDIEDGSYPLATLDPDSLPRRRLLGGMARLRAIPVRDIGRGQEGIPPLVPHAHARSGFWTMLKGYFGGFRWPYLLARIRLRFTRKSNPRVYFFITHGSSTASELALRDNVEVYCDQSGISGVAPIRYDHFLPMAPLGYLCAAWRLRRRAAARLAQGGAARFNGFDYAPYLAPALRRFCGEMGVIAAIKASQTLRLWRSLRPDVVVTGSDVPIPMLTTILAQPDFGYRVVNVEHGLNSTPYGTWAIGCNHPNMTVVVPGEAQRALFGGHQPPGRKPRYVILPIPITSQVERIRGSHRRTVGRVLVLTYSPAWVQTAHRAKKMDRYTLEILRAARALRPKGIRVSLRPPPILNAEYFHYMIKAAGAEDVVDLDREKDFAVSLARHDAVVTNLTTCYYQALYAGWPTIFYEPDFDRRDFLGLIGDAAIDPPRAETPEQLVELIRQALAGEGRVAAFPSEFRDKYLERFLGPNPDKTDEQLARFLCDEAFAAFEGRPLAGHDVPALAR